VSGSTLIRWSGMAALLGGALFIGAILVTLLSTLLLFGPSGPSGLAAAAFYTQSVLLLIGESLLVLGLVGLYVRQSEEAGIVGFISFLVAFFGLALGLANVSWSDLLGAFGWALFGAASLQAGIYPRPAAILLVIGAIAAGLLTPLLGSVGGGLLGYVGVLATIVLNAAIAWLGFSLFTRKGLASVR
jgi:hypothetical protein